MRRAIIATIARSWRHLVFTFIGLLALGTIPTQARDDGRYANSPLKAWFDSLHSKSGGACCSNSDGLALSDADWDTKGGHYRVRVAGEWVNVPTDAVIAEPNRAGHAMVWPYYIQGHPVVRCFLPGTMT